MFKPRFAACHTGFVLTHLYGSSRELSHSVVCAHCSRHMGHIIVALSPCVCPRSDFLQAFSSHQHPNRLPPVPLLFCAISKFLRYFLAAFRDRLLSPGLEFSLSALRPLFSGSELLEPCFCAFISQFRRNTSTCVIQGSMERISRLYSPSTWCLRARCVCVTEETTGILDVSGAQNAHRLSGLL